ncbi:MAG: sensor histidine kinase [Candidatus Dojkabacteria bacterium]
MGEISNTKNKLRIATTALVLFLVISILGIFYFVLAVSTNEHVEEQYFSKLIETDSQLTEYYQSQAGFEAHFISSANLVRQDQIEGIISMTALLTLPLIAVAILAAIYLSKLLIAPIKSTYDAKERFIQDAAHELRNPIGAIRATLQTMSSEKSISSELKLDLQGMIRQTDYLNSLTSDLLFLEKDRDSNPVRFNAFDVALDVVDELRYLAKSRKTKIQVRGEKDSGAVADIEEIAILLRNLITNAINYSKAEGGKVIITVEARKNGVRYIVEDNGIGIPNKDFKLVGSRFFRASNSSTVKGSGLGLSIVKKIAAKYSGNMDIESEEHIGTKVSVIIKNK